MAYSICLVTAFSGPVVVGWFNNNNSNRRFILQSSTVDAKESCSMHRLKKIEPRRFISRSINSSVEILFYFGLNNELLI